MSNQAQQNETLNELASYLVWEVLKQSPLWTLATDNGELDRIAATLIPQLLSKAEELVEREIEAKCKSISKHYDYMDDQILECVR